MAVRFEFDSNLYLGKSISVTKSDKLKRRLTKNPLLANVQLIIPAHNPADQLEIIGSCQLLQPHYKDSTFYVIGLAANRDEAFEVIERITMDCLQTRGDCKLREFLSC